VKKLIATKWKSGKKAGNYREKLLLMKIIKTKSTNYKKILFFANFSIIGASRWLALVGGSPIMIAF
jgi:hypothetical protein